ncbi:carbohydrate-binding module family 50 protein [Aaosphaeria arxii CBS 175.79]|uniref:Carbohydrate-binding module family 50 protein n=1 Tax=Aaosphaeria arxii CBS 175.79 TaxID=1450172 RepID=A0A6A5XC10_9PLEO|nr:carbohydrate-binding module family 50 protein [Aaosphaeria arxii CBS 175.79]KAF2010443.1 carbohydrate-binding module family 50 protein [Aaosphaeria arxii CBS 175.79]
MTPKMIITTILLSLSTIVAAHPGFQLRAVNSTIIISDPTRTTATPSPTGNGITTPLPTQSGMVSNCNTFYKVVSGDTCQSVLSKHNLSFTQLRAWNAGIGDNCQFLLLNTNYCVGVIGGTTTTVAPTPTNGISTPLPTQSGLVDNCDKFYRARPGETCADIVRKIAGNGITLADFLRWNPGVGPECRSMLADTYQCVRVIGFTRPPTTTTGNGVTTPLPTQTGMVGNCNKFEFVDAGEDCGTISQKYGISLEDFKKWNSGATINGCTEMWANTYVCVGIF